MTPGQEKTYLQALASALTINVLIPLVILVLIVLAIWLLINRAQQDPGFNIQNVLRDDNGKESAERLIAFGSFAVTSWVLAVVTFAMPDKLLEALFYYLVFWSGTQIARDLIGKWNGQMPFAKGPP